MKSNSICITSCAIHGLVAWRSGNAFHLIN